MNHFLNSQCGNHLMECGGAGNAKVASKGRPDLTEDFSGPTTDKSNRVSQFIPTAKLAGCFKAGTQNKYACTITNHKFRLESRKHDFRISNFQFSLYNSLLY
jgi:hypothetical protein